jgi:hypothetical protein
LNGSKIADMTDMNSLEAEFNGDMLGILQKEVEADLRSTRFMQMLDEYGGLATAHRLLKPESSASSKHVWLSAKNRQT